ncbi:MAG: bifunctional tetrahydrofolate synthase/dihydrofolate synthase [Arsenophonus endosymbiont of Ceratovacuna japonica]
MIPQINSSLTTWLTYLTNQHSKIIDMGLERVRFVANKLNLLNPTSKIITVTGTNGKGTTCNVLESILIASGLKVGVYNSPHLLDYTERVRIQGKMLPKLEFCRVFSDIESKKGTTTLTYFEYSTLAALQLFKLAKLDIIILEVGLGGRLDATNIIDTDIAVITNVALDHIDLIGDNREQIGYEKSGIFRSEKYAVIGELDIPQSIKLVAKSIGAKLFCYGIDWTFNVQDNHWNWKSKDNNFKLLPLSNINLNNASTALATINCLCKINNNINQKISLQNIYIGLLKAKLPGRFQIISKQPYIILDVAHNPHAAKYLAKKISKLPKQKNTKIYAVVAMLSDKDIKNTLSYLAPQINEWYLTSSKGIRGVNSEKLAQYVNLSLQFSTIKDLWSNMMSKVKKQDIVLVYGSFYIVSKIMELKIKKEKLSV